MSSYNTLVANSKTSKKMGFASRVSAIVPKTPWSIAYLSVTVLCTFAVVILEAFVFACFQDNFDESHWCPESDFVSLPSHDPCSVYLSLKATIPTYMALFIFAGVYQILVALWALSRRNIIQLLMLVFFAFAMLIYAGVQYDQIGDGAVAFHNAELLTQAQARAFIIAIPCIIAAEALVLLVLTWMLYREYNVAVFQKLGPDKSLKRALRVLLFFETIILFDFFFFVGFTLQFVFIILETKDVEFALTIAVIPVTAIVLLTVLVSAYKEIKSILYLFFLLCAAGLAYFIFKLVRIYTTVGRKHIQYLKSKKTLTVFAAITIVFLIITIIYAVRVLRNFGKGLKSRNKVFRANDQFQQEIDLGGPTEIVENGMDQYSMNRSLSIQNSIHTLASIHSMNSQHSYASEPSKLKNGLVGAAQPVSSSTEGNSVHNYNSSSHLNNPNDHSMSDGFVFENDSKPYTDNYHTEHYNTIDNPPYSTADYPLQNLQNPQSPQQVYSKHN